MKNMMTLFKIATNSLLPSTFILIFIILGSFLFMFKKRTSGRIFIALGVIFYFLFSITPVSDFLLRPLEVKYKPLTFEDMQEANKIVLLLGGREANVLRGSEVLRISHLTEHKKTIIISGTDPLLPTSTEAWAVRNFFIHRGVPEDSIIIEGESRNTRENVMNVVKIVEEKPFFLVTSAYHMDRSIREFNRLGASPLPAPADFKRKGKDYNVLDFFPDSQNLKRSDIAFHEYFGTLYYHIVSFFKE